MRAAATYRPFRRNEWRRLNRTRMPGTKRRAWGGITPKGHHAQRDRSRYTGPILSMIRKGLVKGLQFITSIKAKADASRAEAEAKRQRAEAQAAAAEAEAKKAKEERDEP